MQGVRVASMAPPSERKGLEDRRRLCATVVASESELEDPSLPTPRGFNGRPINSTMSCSSESDNSSSRFGSCWYPPSLPRYESNMPDVGGVGIFWVLLEKGLVDALPIRPGGPSGSM